MKKDIESCIIFITKTNTFFQNTYPPCTPHWQWFALFIDVRKKIFHSPHKTQEEAVEKGDKKQKVTRICFSISLQFIAITYFITVICVFFLVTLPQTWPKIQFVADLFYVIKHVLAFTLRNPIANSHLSYFQIFTIFIIWHVSAIRAFTMPN